MLTIEECRRLLGNPDWSDQEIEALRDDLYAWLNRALDEYFASTRALQSAPPPS